MPTAAPRLVFLMPAVVVGSVVAAVVSLLWPHGSMIVVGVVLGLVVAVASVLVLDLRAPEATLRTLDAKPLGPGMEPRLESLVASLCTSHGIAEPSLYSVDSRAPDAAVLGRAKNTHLVVTSGALRQLDRLELEAVVARQLAQLGSGVHAATTLALAGSLLGPLADPLRRAQLDSTRLARMDVQGVLMTRYPPALVGAFERAARGGGVGTKRATEHLWMIGPLDGTPRIQPRLQDRVDALREM